MADYQPPALKVQEQDLQGKVAIVTGATKGIGRAIALDLATRGASILGTYTTEQSAHNFDLLSKTINNVYQDPNTPAHLSFSTAPTIKGVAADITSIPSTNRVIQTLKSDLGGKVDILVLNASYNVHPVVGETTEDDISLSLAANLHWPTTLVENLVREKIFKDNSRVVIVSSDRLRRPRPGFLLYAISKAGLEAMTRLWALELPMTFPGTTVNAVSVGLTDTPLFRSFPQDRQQNIMDEWLQKVTIVQGGRLGFAEDIADIVGFLVSEKARWQTGSVVSANGGAEFIGGSS